MTAPSEHCGVGRALRVGFCVSGQGRLFNAAVEHQAAIGIAPVFLAAGNTASAEVLDLAQRAGITAERLPASTRAMRDAAIGRLIDRTGAELVVLTDHVIGDDLVGRFAGRWSASIPAPRRTSCRSSAMACACGRGARWSLLRRSRVFSIGQTSARRWRCGPAVRS